MGLVGLRLVPVAAFVLVGGCGLRSNPIFQGDTDPVDDTEADTESDTDDEGSSTAVDVCDPEPPVEGRLGSCTNPITLPTTDSSASGMLCGPGLYGDGLCGADDGLEDVYLLAPSARSDVTLTFDPVATDFEPIVRVLEFGCLAAEAVTRVCTDDYFDGSVADPRHFLVQGGRQYFIHIESGGGRSGNYAFSLTFGEPPLQQCDPHSETIFQMPGSVFQWQNMLSPGQGRVDSACGGLGPENMFPVQASYPGNIYVDVFGSGGFRPVTGLRTGCGAATELGCQSETTLATPGLVSTSFSMPGPGLYYLNVDTLDQTGGTYDLTVTFD